MEYNRWTFLIVGYLLTISVEIPILMVGLSPRHSWKDRLLAGFWVNACSYPIVVLVLPEIFRDSQALYLIVAETFAPISECLLFWAGFGSRAELWRRSMWRDFATIILANLASFGVGELITNMGWWGLIFSDY